MSSEPYLHAFGSVSGSRLSKHYGHGNDAVLNYLSRYVLRIAISNARILTMDDTHGRSAGRTEVRTLGVPRDLKASNSCVGSCCMSFHEGSTRSATMDSGTTRSVSWQARRGCFSSFRSPPTCKARGRSQI